jgi:hypothetical protein
MAAPTQEELETSILLMLGEEARVSHARLTVDQIARKFISPIGKTQIQIALQHLTKLGLASSNFDNPRASGFQITRDGIVAIERDFDRIDEAENSSYRPKTQAAFSDDQLADLAEQGTYVFPVPPEPERTAHDTVPAPVIIHNHVNPVFNNSVSSPADPEANRNARSGAIAAWFNVWIALLIGVAVILVSLWIAGKLSF